MHHLGGSIPPPPVTPKLPILKILNCSKIKACYLTNITIPKIDKNETL